MWMELRIALACQTPFERREQSIATDLTGGDREEQLYRRKRKNETENE